MSSFFWLPPDGSLHGPALDRALIWSLAVLAAMLLLAHFMLAYALVRRRGSGSGSKPCVSPKSHALRSRQEHKAQKLAPSQSALLPAFWTAETVPLLLCCVLFAAMAITSERLWAALRYQGASPAAMQVEVVGVQFQWYFRYPGADARFGATRPQLVNAAAGNPLGLDPQDSAAVDDFVSSALILPAGREVDLRLRAHDVIHGFFIPGMRLKENAVPGLVLHVHFTPVRLGSYPILCTQVCGSGHARMQAVLRVVSSQEFAGWLASHERRAASAAAPQGAQ